MIREFCQKNNSLYLAFLVAELPQIDEQVIQYAARTAPKTFCNKLINLPLSQFHEYLLQVGEAMKTKNPRVVDLVLNS